MKQTQSEIELATTTVSDAEPKSNGAAKQKKLSKWDIIKSILMFFTVEPFLLCYIISTKISAPAILMLSMEKACRADLNYSEDICSKAFAGDFSDGIAIEDVLNDVERMVADMTAWKHPVQSGIPAIVILFVGAWSDKTGNRKILMLLPIIGEFVSTLGTMLTTYYFLEWPLWVTGLIEVLPLAFTGGWSVALMGAYSYIADVTTIESRTFGFGILAAIVTLGIPLSSSISSLLTNMFGNYEILGISMLLYGLGFIYIFFRVKDIKRTEIEGSCCKKIIEFFNPKYVWNTISLVVMARGRRLAQVVLVLCAYIVIAGPVSGEEPLVYLCALSKFKMNIVDFSLFSTCSVLMSALGTAIAVTWFSKLRKMRDTLIGLIATACKVASNFVYGFAPTQELFYFGPVIDMFGNSGLAVIRSMGTKIVNTDEVGKMCSLIGFLDAVIPFIYTRIFRIYYLSTAVTNPGSFYVLGGLITIPAFIIFIVLHIIHKRQERDVVEDPHSKEIHSRENADTSI